MNQTEAMTLADRIVVVNEGRIEQVGSPIELYDAPVNSFVAGFIGSPAMNFIDAAADENGIRLGPSAIQIGGGLAQNPAAVAALGVRPEHITVCSQEDADLEATVEIVEKLGAEMMLYLQTEAAEETLTMRSPPDGKAQPGDKLHIRFERARLHLFDQDGATMAT